jgi:hypothetical protein
MNILFKNSDDHGPYIILDDWEISDQLDDYLSEKEYVLYNIGSSKMESGDELFEFWFGKAACEEKIREIIGRFKAHRRDQAKSL